MPGQPAQAGGVGVNDPETVGLRRPEDLTRASLAGQEAPPTGGRAARRRAARAALEAEGNAAGEASPALPEDREGPDGAAGPQGSQEPSAAPSPGGRAARRRAAQAGQAAAAEPAAPGGRAARRKAAQAGRGGQAGQAAAAAALAEAEESGGRAARRRAAKAAAKAAKQTGTAISNVIGELFITTGVLLLLFVVYQLWWTNVEAKAHANNEANHLQEQWDQQGSAAGSDENRDPGEFAPGEGFAILYLPTLDVRVPIAETTDKSSILDNGMVGHYTEADGLPTAMPWDEEGNFGLAGHRNTHGEPFRYINRLEPGDPIVVETENAFYTYEVRNTLDSTPPSNVDVLDPVPPDSGFTEPGRYITLTTCTPEFTSTYRLIVWGEMTEERPRSEGKPDALVN
ncbi:class E sortase [Streptomyces hoynatensis]|uniref:Class E sortase n=2 Tax=Streptomyces hoynatensis TaxID=1141874 RepID=A0A3A9YQ29_9ACTN|nr:class E sortase [Streptomyces hoynatensis]